MENSNVIYLKDATFDEEVLKSDIPVLVDFYADWCGPCQSIAPTIENLSEKYAGKVKICKINIDENTSTAVSQKVMSIPTLFFMKEGKLQERISGALAQNEIETKLDQLLS